MAAAKHAAVDLFNPQQLEMTVLAQQDALIGYYERRGSVRTGVTRPFPADPSSPATRRRPVLRGTSEDLGPDGPVGRVTTAGASGNLTAGASNRRS